MSLLQKLYTDIYALTVVSSLGIVEIKMYCVSIPDPCMFNLSLLDICAFHATTF